MRGLYYVGCFNHALSHAADGVPLWSERLIQ